MLKGAILSASARPIDNVRRAIASDAKGPLYRQIAEALTVEIARGTYGVGDILPSELELAAELGVSRGSVREAMQILADSGLVERARKLGTRVLRREPASSYIQRLSNLNDTLGFGGDTIMRIDDVRDVSDPDEPALRTEVSTTGHWLQITGVRYLPLEQDAPTTWSRVFVSGPFSGIRPLVNGELGAIYSLIEKSYGIRVTRLRHRISAIALPDKAAQALNLPAGTPALRVDAWLYAADRTLVEFVCSIHDPARFSLAFETESISP